ncbi:MAG: response regulator [Deltaproteobacteria bacterium]|nr:response regulator [Deltaproteobacteria bacterium]
MSDGLDVIIVDDEPAVCDVISEIIKSFYVWGDVFVFTDADEAISHCLSRDTGVAIFVLDVYMGGKNAFSFLDEVEEKYPAVHEDTVIITGNASNDVVNMCIASDVHYLLEKPVRPYALQLALRAIVTRYLKFAKRLLQDPSFAESVGRF